jgi:hypothetical protein
MWTGLLSFILGQIGPLIAIFFHNLTQARANDPHLLTMIETAVNDVETHQVPMPDGTTRPYTGAEKREIVLNATLAYAKQLGLDVSTSLVNALIELTVQKVQSPAVATAVATAVTQ